MQIVSGFQTSFKSNHKFWFPWYAGCNSPLEIRAKLFAVTTNSLAMRNGSMSKKILCWFSVTLKCYTCFKFRYICIVNLSDLTTRIEMMTCPIPCNLIFLILTVGLVRTGNRYKSNRSKLNLTVIRKTGYEVSWLFNQCPFISLKNMNHR